MRSWPLVVAGCAARPQTVRRPAQELSTGQPINISPSLFESHLVVGDVRILPDDATRNAIALTGRQHSVGSYKICIDEVGLPTTFEMWQSTDAPDYDAKIEREIWGWQFRPYVVDGKAMPVCSALTFLYSIP